MCGLHHLATMSQGGERTCQTTEVVNVRRGTTSKRREGKGRVEDGKARLTKVAASLEYKYGRPWYCWDWHPSQYLYMEAEVRSTLRLSRWDQPYAASQT